MKKFWSALISIVLAVSLCVTTCTSAFAASFSGKKYVKEMIISYGNTADEAKKWLTDNDYEILDYNLNEGADNKLSTKRAVYIGYKTTDDADEAITDMKLMNMKGGYSVQDYQMLLDEQKSNIRAFFNNFKVAVKEYRNNYNAGQQRAIAAHDLLNMMYDDDTKQNLGDLLLNKTKEEYTDEEYNALSDDEKAKVADMTTILMQANGNAVLAMEQVIALATDDNDTLWMTRYQDAKTYDDMISDALNNDDITLKQATKELAIEYDDDAKKIAEALVQYKSYLENYTNTDITLYSTEDELEAYQKAHEDFDYSVWFTAGTQYELTKSLENDEVSLYDLIYSDEYDVENADRYMLYPLVSVLTEGQRACLDFLPMQQLMAIGLNNDETVKAAMDKIGKAVSKEEGTYSVYEGIDRSFFDGDVALTGEAYTLQNSSGKNPTEKWTDNISTLSLIFYCSFGVSALATLATFSLSGYYSHLSKNLKKASKDFYNKYELKLSDSYELIEGEKAEALENEANDFHKKYVQSKASSKSAAAMSKVLFTAGIIISCVTIVLMLVSLWRVYEDVKAYYNTEFTAIPSHMVNQGVDENDEKVFTYYSAVKCNREEQGMVTDNNKLLEDFGDLNGDVGRQWVALYTTKDKAAGDPITTDIVVQYKDTNIPDDRNPLSIFCESVAQNLTNEKMGYTYNDSKGGIYLFYGADENAFAGSAFSNGMYAFIGGVSAVVVAVAAFFVGRSVERKKKEKANV